MRSFSFLHRAAVMAVRVLSLEDPASDPCIRFPCLLRRTRCTGFSLLLYKCKISHDMYDISEYKYHVLKLQV